MSRGVIFFNHGQKHCARLVVALSSLRQHYGGPISILDTGESGGVAESIAADGRLAVELQQIPFVARRRNSCYVAKSSLWRHSPYDTTVFLDADTITCGSIQTLFDMAADRAGPGFVVTRFSNWITTGDIIRKRIERWHGIEATGIDVERLIRKSLERPHAAINTGIMAWRKDAAILKPWQALTEAGWRTPFTDELAAQLLIRELPHVLLSDRWNCSPIYGFEKEKAVIWHAHGSKHVAFDANRGHEGHSLWWPRFCHAWKQNIGGIQSWAPAGDDRLAAVMLAAGMNATKKAAG